MLSPKLDSKDVQHIDSESEDIAHTEEQHGETELYQLIYLSSSAGSFSKEDLTDILTTSRRNNTRQGITGLLLYHEGTIIQFLEGNESVIQNLYNIIAMDTRHKGVLPLLKRKIERRDFGTWTMGFKNITNEEKVELEGFNDLMNTLSTHTSVDPMMSKPVQRLIQSWRRL
ncbi:protein of unknown function [Taphrina deformans PYCC 5710]|uniref:BLUF domain-containing protein n=1 Tax=Taphrina deformans (strain PYCC 5710 / ATCC 11124 / CBS 356.35 / IMI 108563 / JCM 9778 / NBRC 8474) TaxID=1097556 RepID=R4XG61_TAPDE|nr:protein of unknown function [Taphrina deformans PYCC 5710]|eukprot:CCG84725.1 protein of unknown function [Taphrina deformans PYCC 5710]